MKRIDQMTDDELRERCASLQTEATAIADQIDTAKSKVWVDGQYSDPQWFTDATIALRHKRKAVNDIQMLLGQRRRARLAGNTTPLSVAFFAVASRDLDDADFREMLDEAKAIAAGEAPMPSRPVPASVKAQHETAYDAATDRVMGELSQ